MKIISGKIKHKPFLVLLIMVFGLMSYNFQVKENYTHSKNETVTNILLQDEKPGENEIWMNNLTFIPKIKTISPGTTITWINKETAMHTIVSGTPDKTTEMFKSKRLGKGGKFSYTFKEKGIYKYYCGTHSDQMDGIIIVK